MRQLAKSPLGHGATWRRGDQDRDYYSSMVKETFRNNLRYSADEDAVKQLVFLQNHVVDGDSNWQIKKWHNQKKITTTYDYFGEGVKDAD